MGRSELESGATMPFPSNAHGRFTSSSEVQQSMNGPFEHAFGGLPGYGHGGVGLLASMDTAGPPLPPNFPDPFEREDEGSAGKTAEYAHQLQNQQQMQLQMQMQVAIAMQQQQQQQQHALRHFQQQQESYLQNSNLEHRQFQNPLQQYPAPFNGALNAFTAFDSRPLAPPHPPSESNLPSVNHPSSTASSYTGASLFSGALGTGSTLASDSGRTSMTSLSLIGSESSATGTAGKWNDLLGDTFLSSTLSQPGLSKGKAKAKQLVGQLEVKGSTNSPTATTGRSGSESVMSDDNSLSPTNINRHSLSDEVDVGPLAKQDPLATQVWRMYARDKASLPHAQRMENLTWRMMALALKKKKQKEELEAQTLQSQEQSGSYSSAGFEVD